MTVDTVAMVDTVDTVVTVDILIVGIDTVGVTARTVALV